MLGGYTARIMQSPQHLFLLTNKHPMVPESTLRAGFRLVLHGVEQVRTVAQAVIARGADRRKIGADVTRLGRRRFTHDMTHDAAAAARAVVRKRAAALGIAFDRFNVNGSSIALGHPLGCTGAKLTATLLYEMRRRKVRYGMVTMCVGGGMGAAGIFERM